MWRSLQRAAWYRDALEEAGRPRDSGRIALARALQYASSDEERRHQVEVRRRVLERIGDLARGEGAERYHNAAQLADADLHKDDAALIGDSEEIVARLRRFEAGGIDCVLLIDPAGSTEALRRFAREVMPAFCPPEARSGKAGTGSP